MQSESDDALNWLGQSPMQRMSLGSRELFHSNFLAWLFDTYPAALTVFDLDAVTCEVKREKKNVDLVVYVNGETTPQLLIENKVKSLPEANQLNRYAGKFPNVKKRVLLTLLTPSFHRKPDPEWDTMKYKELGIKLKKWATDTTLKAEHSVYINDYVTLVKNLGIVAESHFDSDRIIDTGYWFSDSDNLQALRPMGFHQSYLKYQAQVFADEYAKTLSEEEGITVRRDAAPTLEGRHVWIWWAMFNGKPCVCFTPYIDQEPSKTLNSIQIEGHQYRRLISGKAYQGLTGLKRTDESGYQKLWTAIESNNGLDWLFAKDFHREGKQKLFHVAGIEGGSRYHVTSMQKNLCQYKPDAIYQYINITKDGGGESLGQQELKAYILRDIDYAFQLLEANRESTTQAAYSKEKLNDNQTN